MSLVKSAALLSPGRQELSAFKQNKSHQVRAISPGENFANLVLFLFAVTVVGGHPEAGEGACAPVSRVITKTAL